MFEDLGLIMASFTFRIANIPAYIHTYMHAYIHTHMASRCGLLNPSGQVIPKLLAHTGKSENRASPVPGFPGHSCLGLCLGCRGHWSFGLPWLSFPWHPFLFGLRRRRWLCWRICLGSLMRFPGHLLFGSSGWSFRGRCCRSSRLPGERLGRL